MRVLVLTEDRSKQAHETLHKLCRAMLKLVDEHVNLDPRRVAFAPLPTNNSARMAMTANLWKQRPPTLDTIRLVEAIAAELRRADAFVFFHADADRTWDSRHESENRAKFTSFIADKVRGLLASPSRSPLDRRPPPAPIAGADLEATLAKLLLLSPCYSIESWLYQATERAGEHCRAHHDSSAHRELVASWASDRSQLDDVWRPKVEALPCVGDKWNEDLAGHVPARLAYEAQRSFAEAVDGLRACTALVTELRHTYETEAKD